MSLSPDTCPASRTEPMRIELGRKWISPREASRLAAGSLLELDATTAGEVTVFVRGRFLARGEPVVVDGKRGVRITEMTGEQPPEWS